MHLNNKNIYYIFELEHQVLQDILSVFIFLFVTLVCFLEHTVAFS